MINRWRSGYLIVAVTLLGAILLRMDARIDAQSDPTPTPTDMTIGINPGPTPAPLDPRFISTNTPGPSPTPTITRTPTSSPPASNALNSPTPSPTATLRVPNDDLAGAIEIADLPYSLRSTTAGSTPERDERLNCYGARDMHSTNYWRYQPDEDAHITIEIAEATFDTSLALMRGSSHPLACVEGLNRGRAEVISAQVEAGETYYIVVAGYSPAVGTFRLNVRERAPLHNDDLENATVIMQLPFIAQGDNTEATVSEGEQRCNRPWVNFGHSLWWVYTPESTTDVQLTVSTLDDYRLDISVYTGDTTSLDCVAGDGFKAVASTTLTMTAGTTYYIAVSTEMNIIFNGYGTYALVIFEP